jgi:hypothetical protein
MQQDYVKAVADFERYLEEGQDDFWLEAARRQLDELREGAGDGPES